MQRFCGRGLENCALRSAPFILEDRLCVSAAEEVDVAASVLAASRFCSFVFSTWRLECCAGKVSFAWTWLVAGLILAEVYKL